MNLEELVSLCKRRGFIYASSSVYGGLQGFFDYGPLGVELKNNIKKLWQKHIVYLRNDVCEIDSALILNKSILKYSGHEDTFHDVLIDCKKCKTRFREDEMIEKKCPKCKSDDLSEKREFNLMMQVPLGPTHNTHGVLRPEAAQGVFVNFKNICDSTSHTLPFGVAQIGKAFRNEITPRNFIFRTREFEQMELEFFVLPQESEKWHAYWVEQRVAWWKLLGVSVQKIKQTANDLAHYSKAAIDLCFEFPHGLEEVEGIANRQDFDLASHTKGQKDLEISAKVIENNESTQKLVLKHEGKDIVPFVIESSMGLNRALLAVMSAAYCQEEGRLVLKLPANLAPIKAAIIPLAKNNSEIVSYAKNVLKILKEHEIFPVVMESGGNIGKCYKKHDEIGTPFCITIDFETLSEQKDTVTVRERDSMKQTRIHIKDLPEFLAKAIR